MRAATVNWPQTLAGVNTTGYIIDLGSGDTTDFDRFTQLQLGVNGTSGDFWVYPFGLDDGGTVPAAPTVDPRPTAGTTSNYLQIKSGESLTLGLPNSKGYDSQTFAHRFYTHILVWCQAAGTVTATQLQIRAQ